jgi:16S rRNA (cytidine1402-2'-O)-methyltransferase
MGNLYIVPTPIGNLEDITLRALRILREVRLIAAEDTRTTHKLLAHFEITTPMTAYHEHNKIIKLDALLDALKVGDVALVSDAGTPGISDPGYELIREAIAHQIPVISLPGPSAVITTLVASGLPTDGYVYLGFLPRKDKALRDLLIELARERRTLVAYESPNRLLDALLAVRDILGERPVAVGREMTKLFEEVRRGSITEVISHFQENEPRGEITLVIGGQVEQLTAWDETAVLNELRSRLADGISRKDAVRLVVELSGWDRRTVYDLSLNL